MKYELEVERREKAGKGVARQLRLQGKIPGVMYGGGKSQFLALEHNVARKLVLSQVGHTGLLTVKMSGESERVAVLQDHQLDPVTGAILHIDLFEVSMEKPIRVKVPVSITGAVPKGVKEGGIVHQPLRELHIECLPGLIPDHIEVMAENLGVGEGIHVKDVQVPEGVKILDDQESMVVHLAMKMSEAKLESMLTREVAESAAAPADDKAKAEGGATAAAPASEGKAKESKK
ncbi:MAG: 50S ribosomal protein L25 [Nitrospirae bacterium]|nr:50S ribosomal protein L25 [Nitrospirota bacterium]